METGMVIPFAGASAPSGYLICDGASYLRSSYSDLFSVIGTVFGAADSTHFNVPDMRGRVPVGAGQGDGNMDSGTGVPNGAESLDSHLLGDWFGGFEQAITEESLPGHSHEIETTHHTHNILGLEHTHTVTNPPHNHTQNSHYHAVPGRNNSAPGDGFRFVVADGSGGTKDLNLQGTVATNQPATQTTSIATALNDEWVTQNEYPIEYIVSRAYGGGSERINVRNPSLTLNYLIKI